MRMKAAAAKMMKMTTAARTDQISLPAVVGTSAETEQKAGKLILKKTLKMERSESVRFTFAGQLIACCKKQQKQTVGVRENASTRKYAHLWSNNNEDSKTNWFFYKQKTKDRLQTLFSPLNASFTCKPPPITSDYKETLWFIHLSTDETIWSLLRSQGCWSLSQLG